MTWQRAVDAIAQRKNPKVLERLGRLLSENAPDVHLDEAEEAWREVWREYLSQFDTAIIDAAGMTVDDMVSYREQRQNQRAAGKDGGNQANENIINWFADSAIESEQQGLTFTKAVDKVMSDLGGYQMKKETARNWLKKAIKFGVIEIEPPKRGRPKKNS